ncbi:hypothetical protein [Brevundimonas sp. R86498]|uniref:hypothetical protein n=1 Tax=Brevundimonas sp. R86498 TaxID=3093845 RepID=UPI0037CB2490
MRFASFSIGTLFDFDGRRYRLVNRLDDGAWQAVDIETNRLVEWPWNDMAAAYEANHLSLAPTHSDGRAEPATPVRDMSQRQQEKVLSRARFLEAAAARLRGHRVNRADLAGLLAEVSDALGFAKPVSVASYYRWKKSEERGGTQGLAGNKMGPKGRHCSGVAIARQVVREQILAAHQTRKVGAAPVATLKSMQRETRRRIQSENARRRETGGSQPLLSAPSPSTFHRVWKEFSAEDRSVVVGGKNAARHLYRGGRGLAQPHACLDLAEYDETRVPMFVFEESLGIPLGRPWLSWYVDVYSDAPTGFYLGFEPPGDLTITSALRHSCLPKAYVAREYPDIANTYAPAGIPRKVTFDNGLSQWSNTIEALGLDLKMSIQYATPRTPWFKPRVEGMFNLLNQTILRELPGFVLGKGMHEYDPQKHGCIGLRHLLYLLHVWLVDIYLQEPRGMLLKSPAAAWEEGTREFPPDFLPRSHDLDFVFGIVRSGRLDHRGVRLENLWFQSPELQALRRQHGEKLGVEIKFDPSNLAYVHARIPNRPTGWVRAEAVFKTYAQGLSLHRHKLNQRNAREKFGEVSATNLARAHDFLHELIADALPAAMSIRTNSLIARALGIGTQHAFNNLNHDGELQKMSGPFAGSTLNPLSTPEVEARNPSLSPSAPIAVPERKRTIPAFDGDRLLGRRGS